MWLTKNFFFTGRLAEDINIHKHTSKITCYSYQFLQSSPTMEYTHEYTIIHTPPGSSPEVSTSLCNNEVYEGDCDVLWSRLV